MSEISISYERSFQVAVRGASLEAENEHEGAEVGVGSECDNGVK